MFVFTSVVGFSYKEAFISISCNKQPYSNDYFFSFKKLLLCFTEVSICQFYFQLQRFDIKHHRNVPNITQKFSWKCFYLVKSSY